MIECMKLPRMNNWACVVDASIDEDNVLELTALSLTIQISTEVAEVCGVRYDATTTGKIVYA